MFFQKHHLVHFVLSVYCSAWGQLLSMVGIPSKTSRCQWEMDSRLVMGTFVVLPLSTGMPSGLDFCRPCANSHRIHECICTSLLCLEDIFSLVSSILSSSYSLSTSSTAEFPESWRVVLDGVIPFRLFVLSFLTLCILWISVFPYHHHIYCRRKLLYGDWERHWSMSITQCHWESCYCFFPLAEQ